MRPSLCTLNVHHDVPLHRHRRVRDEPVALDLRDEAADPRPELDALGVELDRRAERARRRPADCRRPGSARSAAGCAAPRPSAPPVRRRRQPRCPRRAAAPGPRRRSPKASPPFADSPRFAAASLAVARAGDGSGAGPSAPGARLRPAGSHVDSLVVLPREYGSGLVGFGAAPIAWATRSWSESSARGGGPAPACRCCGCTNTKRRSLLLALARDRELPWRPPPRGRARSPAAPRGSRERTGLPAGCERVQRTPTGSRASRREMARSSVGVSGRAILEVEVHYGLDAVSIPGSARAPWSPARAVELSRPGARRRPTYDPLQHVGERSRPRSHHRCSCERPVTSGPYTCRRCRGSEGRPYVPRTPRPSADRQNSAGEKNDPTDTGR